MNRDYHGVGGIYEEFFSHCISGSFVLPEGCGTAVVLLYRIPGPAVPVREFPGGFPSGRQECEEEMDAVSASPESWMASAGNANAAGIIDFDYPEDGCG
jgi:hypothetical protein